MRHKTLAPLFACALVFLSCESARAGEVVRGGKMPATVLTRTFSAPHVEVGDAPEPPAFNEGTPDDVKTRACEPLKAENLKGSVKPDELVNCFVELRKVFDNKNLSLAEKKKRALSIPSVRERAFLGFVLGCYGEALAKGNLCDRSAVMLAMQNRARICNEQDPRPIDKRYSPLDIAFQYNQFSAFNPREYGKRGLGPFEANPSKPGLDNAHMRKCIEAFPIFAHHEYPDFVTRDQRESQILPGAAPDTSIVTRVGPLKTADKPQKAKASEIAFYFASDLTKKHKTPEWADWSKITDINCKTPHGSEAASHDHLLFTDEWDCRKYAKSRHRQQGKPKPL